MHCILYEFLRDRVKAGRGRGPGPGFLGKRGTGTPGIFWLKEEWKYIRRKSGRETIDSN